MDIYSLEKKARHNPNEIGKIVISSTKFIRNQYVSGFVKRKAEGICQDCHKSVPFISKNNSEPFLETHHIIPLIERGMEII